MDFIAVLIGNALDAVGILYEVVAFFSSLEFVKPCTLLEPSAIHCFASMGRS